MKNTLSILTILAIVTLCHPLEAQVNRSRVPLPGPAPLIHLGTPDTFTTSNGIKVFVVERHEIPKVSVSLILDNDPVLEKSKAGYVEMEGEMMRRGTPEKSKAQLDESIAYLGGSVQTSSGGAFASALATNFTKLFAIYSDIILHPSFPDSELVKLKRQTLSALDANKDDPGSILDNVSSRLSYGTDHPYGEVETPQTVRQIRRSDLLQYYKTYWKPNKAYMAFVGDISPREARHLVDTYLGSWKPAPVPAHTYPFPALPDSSQVVLVNRPSAVQTNINITHPVRLKPGSPDGFAAQIMNQILGGGSSGLLFQDLREKYAFTYGAYSSISSDPVAGSFSAGAAVRTAVTDSAIWRFLADLKYLDRHEVSTLKLDSVKNHITGNFALALEDPARIAQFAINIDRYHLPSDYYAHYLQRMDAVSAQQVRDAARKFLQPQHSYIILVGNTQEFAPGVARFGKVQYVDIYGNPVGAPASRQLPAGVTVSMVLDENVKAIGGAQRIGQLRDLDLRYQASDMGRQAEVERKYLLPDTYEMTMQVPSLHLDVVKVLVKDTTVLMTQMGRKIPLTPAMNLSLRLETRPFAVQQLEKKPAALKLLGIETVNGSDAYVVEDHASHEDTKYYFDTRSGMLLRKSKVLSSPRGPIVQTSDYSEYRSQGGLEFPGIIRTVSGKQQVVYKLEQVRVNSGLKAQSFR